MELLPSIERCYLGKHQQLLIPTLGYTKRCNFFVTLFWPQKNIVWNCYKRRRNIEFRKHLSNLIAYAKRHKLRKIILFIDQATAHDTLEVEKFLKNHPIIHVKFLGKKDPNSNPVECLVNKRLHSAVSVNRSYENIHELEHSSKSFLRKYNVIYAT